MTAKPTDKREDVGWMILNGVGEFIVIEADVTKIHLKLMLFQEKVGTKFIASKYVSKGLSKSTHSNAPIDKFATDTILKQKLEKKLLYSRRGVWCR